MGRILTSQDVGFAVKGGSVFACGGGGWADHGYELGNLAVTIGRPELVGIEEVAENDWIATAAAIGAPAGLTDWQMLGIDYVNAFKRVEEALGEPISGLMVGQNGMSSTLNAWLPSAVTGCKVIDAVGDLRAHPTGDMGSIGLAASPQPMIQAAVGGNRQNNSYIEMTITGATAKVSPVIRTASDMSGGFIASCRNPIPASYVRHNAALGGISLALSLGEAITKAEKTNKVVDAICNHTGGKILCSGKVKSNSIRYTNEAFDIGTVTIGEGANKHTIHIMNEHMAVENANGERVATYPDVITTLDRDGNPVSAGHIKEGMELVVFHIHHNQIPLSSSVKDPTVYPVAEKALGISLYDYFQAGQGAV